MKQLILIILTVLLMTSCNKEDDKSIYRPQPNYSTFIGHIGTNDNSTIFSNDQNLIICGNIDGNLSLHKIRKTGEQVWKKNLGIEINSPLCGITKTRNGELFICGTTIKNYATTRADILLTKTNATGDTIWTKSYGGIEFEYGTNVVTTSDGNLLILGSTTSFGAGSYGDIYLIKVNTNGDTLWTRSYPDPNQEVPFHLMETQNGEYLVTGTNEEHMDPRELYLLKVNSKGEQVWNKKIGSATWKWGFSTIELSNGDLVTCGQHTSNGYSQVLLVKTDHIGNVIWEKEFGDDKLSEQGNSVKQNADGSFIITGSSYDVTSTQTDIILLKVDANGSQLFLKKFGSLKNDEGANLIKDSNDDNIITGNYNGSIFMMLTDHNGVFK